MTYDPVISLRNAGKSYKKIREETGVPVYKIAMICDGTKIPRKVNLERARAMRASGLTLREIAAYFSVSVATVHQTMFPFGVCRDVTKMTQKHNIRGRKPIDRAKVQKLLKIGLSTSEIAERMGITPHNVYRVMAMIKHGAKFNGFPCVETPEIRI